MTSTPLRFRAILTAVLTATLALSAFAPSLGDQAAAYGQQISLSKSAKQVDAPDDSDEEEGEEPADASTQSRLSAEAVRSAINGAIAFLKSRQRKKGEWDEYPGYAPGTTSLCVLALLTAGLDKTDPNVARALEFLDGVSPMQQNQTYPIALQTMVFCQADPEKYADHIRANVAWLTERQMKTHNEHAGGWSYVGSNQESERADNSNSQFALLALYEAELAGFEIDEKVWSASEDYWFRMQNDDGSWGYRSSTLNPAGFPSGYGTGSMTCAGIAALAICSGVRETARARLDGDSAYCCQDQEDESGQRIARGIAWLGKHFSVRVNPGRASGGDSYFYYYMYGLERVGRLTANRFIGGSDWYREGAEVLLRRKGALADFWVAQKDFANNNSVTTSFALLFLSKGRWPTLVSKLKYGEDGEWNEHPSDVAHLVERAELEWDQKMVWQTIDSARATVDDYIQTPILAINGTRSPIPSDPEARRRMTEGLRGYLDQGGFILAEAIDGDVSFEKGFRELMKDVAGEDTGDFQLLDASHPVWSAEKLIPGAYVRPVYGLDYGCRTSVVLIPAYRPEQKTDGSPPSIFGDRPSLSCLWEAAAKRVRGGGASPSTKALAEQEAAFDLGVNICSYATNRRVKFKDEIAADVAEELEKDREQRASLFVGLLDCGAGSSCAPRAVPNLMKTIRSRLGVPAQLYAPRVRAGSDDLFDCPVLFMHGRNAFSFSEGERERLGQFFDRGGFLFVNAVCGSTAFTLSVEEEIAAIFPGETLLDVPADDPIYSGKYGGFKIEKLQYRRRQKKGDDSPATGSELYEAPPRLKGVLRNGRWVLLFSRDDVSCALENSVAANCEGLSQKSAFYLCVNVLFYAAESF